MSAPALCRHMRLRLSLLRADEGKHRLLRVHPEDDPQITRHFMRPHQHLAVFLLDASYCLIDVRDVEIEQPEWNGRILRISRHHGAHWLSAVIENAIDATRSHVHCGVLTPAKEFGVERP